jgi:hypothetical protein
MNYIKHVNFHKTIYFYNACPAKKCNIKLVQNNFIYITLVVAFDWYGSFSVEEEFTLEIYIF